MSLGTKRRRGALVGCATTARTNDIDMVRNLGADEVIDFTKKDSADVLTGSDLVLVCLEAQICASR